MGRREGGREAEEAQQRFYLCVERSSKRRGKEERRKQRDAQVRACPGLCMC